MTFYGLLAIASLSVLSLGASPAEAKPNRTNPGGCSMSQLQHAANDTAAGRECSRRQDESVINGTTFIMFVCTSEGVYCCPSNAGSAADCTKISAASVTKGVLDKISPGLTTIGN
jgi:hypothetical protein